MSTGIQLPTILPESRGSDNVFHFDLDPRIDNPKTFPVAFLILLDGDMVMSPEHLGVALMTAVLRRGGFPVRIMEVPTNDVETALEDLQAFSPRLICFTLMSLNVESCKRLCKMIRQRLPGIPIACGGPAGTYASGQILEYIPEVDIVAVGEGEPTIWDLVQTLYLNLPLDSCKGIWYRHREPGGAARQTPVRPLMHNLDDLPYPARDQFEQHGNDLEYVRLTTSRGCVARCTFCSAPNISNRVQKGKAWRGRSVESILDEVEGLVKHYRYRTYDFIDSTFEDPDGGRIGKDRVRRIAQGIIDRGLDIYYNCCMRAENWSDDPADHQLLDLLAQSGLEKANVGIESGTARELQMWDKLATVEDNIRIIRLLRQHGIYLAMGFIQFHPYATVETLTENACFLKNHAGHNLRRLTERLEIYPGTVIIEHLRKDGLLMDDYFKSLHHFGYRFQDERVERLSTHFASIYNNEDYHQTGVITEQSAVFKFETFNVVLDTYISRTRRKFGHLDFVREELAAFSEYVQEVRRQLADYNYSFFMSHLEAVLAAGLTVEHRLRDIAAVEEVFSNGIRDIKNAQLRLGKRLTRAGADLSRISSSMVVSETGGAPRTYTGGAPCW